MNFITHFLSPERDLCTSTSALRIHHFFSVPCLSPVAYGFTAICLGRHVWERMPPPSFGSCSMALPSSMVASVETHLGLLRKKVNSAPLLAVCIGAFSKPRITMLYGMEVNSMGFGGRPGAASWLYKLASYVNSSALVALCVRRGDRNSPFLIVMHGCLTSTPVSTCLKLCSP